MNSTFKDQGAYNKIKKARTSLILHHPFFASLALRLQIKEDYSCHTAWTDGDNLGYNPHYINMLSSKKLEGLTAHIVMHPACGHHLRRGTRDHNTWNKACDFVINGILVDAGFTLPDGYLINEEYQDRSAENVYSILSAGDAGDSEQEVEENENEQEAEGADDSTEQEDNQESDEGRPEEDEDDGEDGESNQPGDPGLSGEVRDGDKDSGGGEGEDISTDWDEALIQAAITARGLGKLPSSIERLIDQHLKPQVNWQQLLLRFIEKSARSDYSWQQPNKRFIHQGIYLPSLRNCELENIFIAVDTSGSISQQDLELFSSEINDILNQNPARVHLIYCDYRISEHREYSRNELPIEIAPHGGGGTDYRPVFQYIESENMLPACLIYLTDLECKSFPKTAPHYPTLWVNVGDVSKSTPFGEIINMK